MNQINTINNASKLFMQGVLVILDPAATSSKKTSASALLRDVLADLELYWQKEKNDAPN
jgi:hypothetical protein